MIYHEVVLSDGNILHADLSVSGDVMWIWIRDAADPLNSMTALAEVLSHPEATQEIVYFLR